MKTNVFVIGGGTIGLWTALKMQQKGYDVTLFDPHGPGNRLSSSGGTSRIIRSVYGHQHIYSRWALHAFPQWKWLEDQTKSQIFHQRGALWILRQDEDFLKSAAPGLKELEIEYEFLDPDLFLKKYPFFSLHGVESICFEPAAGFLVADRAMHLLERLFREKGGRRFKKMSMLPGSFKLGDCMGVRDERGDLAQADLYIFAC